MTTFRFHLIGTTQVPIIDVAHADLRELNDAIERQRFVEGKLVEIDGRVIQSGVLISINRIQMISEVEN